MLKRDLEFAEVPPRDVIVSPDHDVRRLAAGRSWERKRFGVTALLAAALALAVAIPINQFSPPDRPAPTLEPWGNWAEIAPAPLSPRRGTIATWSGTEALFWGGTATPNTCGLGECDSVETAREGAAYDPATQRWRELAPAPLEVSDDYPHAQMGDRFIVAGANQAWWSYRAAANQWSRLPDAPEVLVAASVATHGNLLYAVGNGLGDRVNVLDTVAARWSTLPASPFTPRLSDRTVVATDRGILVIGRVFGESPDGYTPIFRAEFFDGDRWSRVPEQVPWADACCWEWMGERLIIPANADSAVPSMQKLGFSTSPFPRLSETEKAVRWSPRAVDTPLLASNGFVYDDRDGVWSRITRPVGAPDRPGAAVWADGELIVLQGRASVSQGDEVEASTSRVWVYTPRG